MSDKWVKCIECRFLNTDELDNHSCELGIEISESDIDVLHKCGCSELVESKLDAFSISIIKKNLLKRLNKLAEYTVIDLEKKFGIKKNYVTIDDVESMEGKLGMIIRNERAGYTGMAKDLKLILDTMIDLERVRDHPETLTDEEKKIFGVK